MKKTYVIIAVIVSVIVLWAIAIVSAWYFTKTDSERCVSANSIWDIAVYCRLAYNETITNYEQLQNTIKTNSENKKSYQDKYCTKQGFPEWCLDILGKE